MRSPVRARQQETGTAAGGLHRQLNARVSVPGCLTACRKRRLGEKTRWALPGAG